MHLTWIDWTIMAVCIVALRLISASTRHYVKGVADFLSANRSAGRYLLTIGGQMGGTGAISVVALFEMYYSAGLPPIWWSFMSIPVGVIVLLTGWVYYRYRETRAFTMAQFLEMRYSRRFRAFSGFLIWGSGILNFGIFPAVAARFIMYFCGLPEHFQIPGIPYDINTFLLIMGIDLALALMFVTMGGQVTVMVTECVQGMVSAFIFIVVSGAILLQFSWSQISEALSMAPQNASMLHPFNTSHIQDFNVWYYVIGLFGTFYAASSWQGSSGFMTSGRSPHEQKMGGIIGLWRGIPLTLMIIVLPLAAYAVLHLPEFSTMAATVNAKLGTIDNESIKNQMRVPIVLANLLPAGIKGLLATVMIFFSFTCHDTYMHSWGSIFVQDVYMPIADSCRHGRSKMSRLIGRLFWMPDSPDQHIKLLRYSIIFVAVFAFVFSWLYPPDRPILMFFAITGTIWAGGSGAVIIGGLYWRRGTTSGAYSALIFGATVGVGGLIVPNIYRNRLGLEFPVNSQWLWMVAMLGATMVYIVVSLLSHRRWKRQALVITVTTAGISAGAALFGGRLVAGVAPDLYKFITSQHPIVEWIVFGLFISLVYTLVCLVICRKGSVFNLEQMLHRGRYAVASDQVQCASDQPGILLKIFGITREFTIYDRILAVLLVVWNLGWFAAFAVVSLMNLVHKFPEAWWISFWRIYIWTLFAISIPATIWFTVGGVLDLKALLKSLDTSVRDHTDDGRVIREPAPSATIAPAQVEEGGPVAQLQSVDSE